MSALVEGGVTEQKPTHIISTATASVTVVVALCEASLNRSQNTATAAVVLQGVVRGVTGQKPTHIVLQLQLQ